MNKSEYRSVFILVRYIWPLVLTFKFLTYAFFDNPTHLAFWHATRIEHATFYIIPTILILFSIGPTRRRLLIWKAGLITGVALTSFLGDLWVDKYPRLWNSASTWLLVGVANIAVVWMRLSCLRDLDKS